MPLYAVADFCLIPMSTPTPSVGIYITECQRVLESYVPQGIKYEMHGYGTNLEGPFPLVCAAIEACHEAVHKLGCPRIATDIRIGTRVDKVAQGQEEQLSEAWRSGKGAAVEAEEQEQWGQGLSENQRKRESVRRRLAKDGDKGTS